MWVPATPPASAHMLHTLCSYTWRLSGEGVQKGPQWPAPPSPLCLSLLLSFAFFSSLHSVIVTIILEHPPRSRHRDRCLSHNVSPWDMAVCILCVRRPWLSGKHHQGSGVATLSPTAFRLWMFLPRGGGFASKDTPDCWLSPLPEEEGSALI